jgi:hypothetical protein
MISVYSVDGGKGMEKSNGGRKAKDERNTRESSIIIDER